MQSNRMLLRVVVVLLLAAFLGRWLFVEWKLFRANLSMAFAEEQINIFYQMKQQAVTGDEKVRGGSATYLQNYYPSGTKQIAGSIMDRIVEKVRSETLREAQR